VLLPTSHDVRILEKPSWLTRGDYWSVWRLFSLSCWWHQLVRHGRQEKLHFEIVVREKETAQHELQQGHDQLRNGSKSGLLS